MRGKSMSRSLRLLSAALCLAAALALIVGAGLPERTRANAVLPNTWQATPVAPEVGALAPPVEAPTVAGKRFSLAVLRGSPVIINFWATWCGPCLSEMPLLQSTYEAKRAGGLRIVGVDSGETPADVMAWQAQLGLTYDLVTDRDGLLASLYRVRGLPSTYFVGRDGLIKRIVYGPLDATSLEAALRELGATS
jgi:cytochrome c biogenesis protein CcmG/thiol:disulfide interchange protein DsbE